MLAGQQNQSEDPPFLATLSGLRRHVFDFRSNLSRDWGRACGSAARYLLLSLRMRVPACVLHRCRPPASSSSRSSIGLLPPTRASSILGHHAGLSHQHRVALLLVRCRPPRAGPWHIPARPTTTGSASRWVRGWSLSRSRGDSKSKRKSSRTRTRTREQQKNQGAGKPSQSTAHNPLHACQLVAGSAHTHSLTCGCQAASDVVQATSP